MTRHLLPRTARTVVGAVALALVLALAALAPGRADAATAMTARAASKQLTAGQHALVGGNTGTKVRRSVLLQRYSSGAWRTVSRVMSGKAGGFSLEDPVSRVGKYRAKAPTVRIDGRRYLARTAYVGTLVWRTTTPTPTSPAPPAERSVLGPNEALAPGQRLLSPSGVYQLVMQSDGNLVVYQSGVARWSSSTNPTAAGGRVVMQGDGNLVLRRTDGTPAWTTATDTFDGANLVMQDDGNLVVYRDGRALWSRFSGQIFQNLRPGETLGVGQQIISRNHRYRLVMQGDGNLVHYDGGTALWSSRTAGTPGATAVMQGDGNLVVYRPGGVAVWASGTAGRPGAFLAVQDDSNLVIYQSGAAVWTRSSSGGSASGGGVVGDDYPAYLRNAALDALVDPWRFFNRECTSFVAWRLNNRNGLAFSNYMRGGHFGNASNWAANARGLGYAVNATPAVGAVATAGNHVAWVASVGNGNVTIEEYNYGYTGRYHSRTVPTSTFQYIHLKDLG